MPRQRVSLRDWPRLTRFYGIPPKDLARMPFALLSIYAEQLLELSAEETLEAMTVSDMPYMKDSERSRIRRQYTRWLGEDEEKAEDKTPTVEVTSEHGKAAAARYGFKVIEDEG